MHTHSNTNCKEQPSHFSLVNSSRGLAIAAPCGKWGCRSCGRYKASKVARRAIGLRPDYLLTFSAPPGFGWATPHNLAAFQRAWRVFYRWSKRHRLVDAYLWVREVSDDKGCVCLKPGEAENRGLAEPRLRDCACGAGGNRLHRHMVIRSAGPRNRYGRPWLPYQRIWAAWERAWNAVGWQGEGRIQWDAKPISRAAGAVAYVTKYLTKSIGDGIARRRRFGSSEPPLPSAEGWQWKPYPVEAARVFLAVGERFDLSTGEIPQPFQGGIGPPS